MAENITLDQLAGNAPIPMGGTINPKEVKPVDLSQIGPPPEEPDTPARNAFEKEAYDSIDAGIERYTKEFHEDYLKIKEKAEENDEDEVTMNTVTEATSMEYKEDEESDTENKADTTKPKEEESSNKEKEEEIDSDDEDDSPLEEEDDSFELDDEDLSDLDVDDETKDDEEEIDAKAIYEEYKDSIRKNINIVSDEDKIDISAFKKGSKITSVRALDKATPVVKYSADHILYSTGVSVSMEPLNSDEIVQFDPSELTKWFDRAERNINRLGRDKEEEQLIATVNTFRQYNKLFLIIYNHITSAKPDYNTWLSSINWADIEDLMFLAYKATYGVLSNKITVNCEDSKCSHIFIREFDIKDMVAFKDDSIREKYNKMMQLPDGEHLEPVKYIEKQVSRDFVFVLKAPSLYTMLVESTCLPMETLKKHNNLFNIYQYVDKIYFIDREAGELKEIEFKKFADVTKTVKSKLKAIGNIIKTLSTDQRQSLIASTAELDRDQDDLYYVMPETTCEKCGKVISRQRIQSAELLFTRFRLTLHLS